MKFDVRRLEKLNDPGRLQTLDPDRMWEALGAPQPETVVEIGAGTGLFAREFLYRAPGSVVYAADVEDAMLAWMRDNLLEVRQGRIVPMKSWEDHIPLPDDVADLVYMINLYHELDDSSAVYAEAYRMLRPAGRVMVVDWKKMETPKGPPLSVRAGMDELKEALSRAGFIEVRGHDVLVWHDMVTAVRPIKGHFV